MVLIRNLVFCLGLLVLAACSNVQKQQVVAVNSGGTGEMSASSSQSGFTQTPKAVFDLLARAQAASNQSNWIQAIRYLDQAQRMAPDEAKVYLEYGETYIKQGKNTPAAAMLKHALSLAGNSSPVGAKAKSLLEKIDSL